MKLIARINPKNLFNINKAKRSLSRSEVSSFTSSDSPDSDVKLPGLSTPKTVLPSSHSLRHSSDDDWSESSAALQFELEQAFKIIDADGDGLITRSELEALLSRVGTEPPSQEELTLMLSEVDRDGDGSISLEEFGAISSAFGNPACETELRDAFNFFDTDHDGKITADELFAVFRSIGDERCTLEDCKRMINGVDKKGDGFVCFADFAIMMGLQR